MTKITVKPDCGNSPKKAFLRDLNVAFAKADLETISDSVTDDISWHIVGDRRIDGKAACLAALKEMSVYKYKASALTIHAAIAHGYDGAVNGEHTTEDGKRYGFCDVWEHGSFLLKQHLGQFKKHHISPLAGHLDKLESRLFKSWFETHEPVAG